MLTLRSGGPLAAAATLALLAFGIGSASAQGSGCQGANRVVDASHLGLAQSATLCLLNQERRRYGLAPLHASEPLARIARGHSLAMVRGHFFAHGAFLGRIQSSGFLSGARSWAAGENIAWGGGRLSTPAAIVDGWMHSPPHRANILNGGFRWIGVGVAVGTPNGGGGATYTTDFGARS